jgi:hypothetical protein
MIIMKSNKPTKTKKAMKTMKKFLSMAVLALVGAVMTGCSNDDEIIETPQQPVNSQNVETLTTTVGFDKVAETRALTSGGVKTFAAGDQLALVYKNKSGQTVKTLSTALPSGDYGSSATFTFELVDADKTKDVTYIYPASMAKADGTVNYDALNSQNGTLATLSSTLDLATYTHAWDGASLPTGTLVNPLVVCALTLKNSDGSSTITSGLTQVTVSDGSNTYTVAPTSGTFGEAIIYVAIRPVTAALQYTATDGTKNYTKTATSREYAAGNFYNLGLMMVEPVPALNLTNPAVGQVIGDDGKNYNYASKPSGVTAVAKICYVSGSIGLALALADEGELDWSTAMTTCAAHTPAFTGGTWKLATQEEWENMISTAGSHTDLRDGFSSVGGTNMQLGRYWSSSEVDSESAWLYYFGNGQGYSIDDYKDSGYFVRACLAW